MKELTDGQILHHLRQNTIGRNKQLSVLVRLLNSAKENTVLAIDGPWGSGKTVFIKQLLMLADKSIEDYGHNALDDAVIESFRDMQQVYYFNAWENDYIGDALGAILLRLIANGDEGLNEAAVRRAFGMIDPSAAIKTITHDLINLSAKTKKEKLIEHVQSVMDRHGAVNEFLDEIKGDNERIVFVVDELDRCKPSFAVDLLEVMKHYFVRDDVTFILATNATELAHTIQKYYGYSFDGYAYLNKFFDFTFDLAAVDVEEYARLALSWSSNGYTAHNVAYDAIRYLNLQMREINAYHSALRTIDNFLRRERNWHETQWSVQLVFTPIALAMKVKNDSRYSVFVRGGGADFLAQFLLSSGSALRYASTLVENRASLQKEELEKQSIAALVGHYNNLFKPEGRRSSESLQDFNDAVSLMSGYTTISEAENEK